MNIDNIEEFEDGDFTPAERRHLRHIMRDWDRYQWAWSLIVRIGMWTAGVIATIYAAREPIARVFRALFSPHVP